MTHPGWHHVEEHAQGFPKMCDLWGWWWFKPKLEALEVESNFKKENRCHKKKTRPQFFFKSLFLLREVSKLDLKTSLRRNKDLNFFWARIIFFDIPCPRFFFLKFDSTLRAYNYGLNHQHPHKLHIFGKPWACSSTWCYPRWVKVFEKIEKQAF